MERGLQSSQPTHWPPTQAGGLQFCYPERSSLGVVVHTKALNSGGVELSIDKGSQSVWSEGFNPRSQLFDSKG